MAQTEKKKNILVLFCDQFRYDCVAALGNDRIQTPALDSIANEACIYPNAVTPAPVCVPARLSMMAGQYCNRTGNSNNNPRLLYSGEGFYARLTRAGYSSACIGKMHYVWDKFGSLGFERRISQEEMSDPDDDYTKFIKASPYKNVFDYNGQRSEMYYVPQVSGLPAEAHPTQWIGDRAVEYIESYQSEKPMFLFASFIHPHPPFCPPAPWNKLYRSTEVKRSFIPETTRALKPLLHSSFDCDRMGLTDIDVARLRDFYYACVSFVDYQVGRIIAALKEKGMYDDTLIVFSSDHGECLGDYRNMGKRTMLASASRIPFFIRLPDGERATDERVVSLVDLAPTLLTYAGAEYEREEFDGVDILHEEREFVYSQYNCKEKGCYMVASNRDKLIYNSPEQKYYYFDEMPEITDKYDPEVPRIAEMKCLLDAYMASDIGENPPQKKNKPKDIPHPLGANRMDHKARHDEESARIPEGYTIDLRANLTIDW